MSECKQIYANLIEVMIPEVDSSVDTYDYIVSKTKGSNISEVVKDKKVKELHGVILEPGMHFYINLMIGANIPKNDSIVYNYVPFNECFFSFKEETVDGKIVKSFENAIPIIHFLGTSVLKKHAVRRLNFIDSSIWHYAVNDKDSFTKALSKIKRNKEYYKLIIAQESAELNKRMYINSELFSPTAELVDNIEKDLAGHAQSIVPFKFHSEEEMKQKSCQIVEDIKKTYLEDDKKLTWRLLLVDDHAKDKMSVAKGSGVTTLRKTDILLTRLEEIAELFNTSVNDLFEFSEETCLATSIVGGKTNSNNSNLLDDLSAIKKISERRYDIIILDYLLKEDLDPTPKENMYKKICLWNQYTSNLPKRILTESRIDYSVRNLCTNSSTLMTLKLPQTNRWYGYMLLSYISNLIGARSIHKSDHISEEDRKQCELLAKELKAAKGICGKFWFMFSSGFASAVHDRLLTEGFSYSNRNWYIGRTACPTTTPELFKYNLLTMMKNQLDYITKIGLEDVETEEHSLSLIDLLRKIFIVDAQTRDMAIRNFNNLLMMRARYKLLAADCDYKNENKKEKGNNPNGSQLVQALLYPEMKEYNNAFWEHIQHLVYLVAYGNIRQWNEMWDEYVFIKERIERAEEAFPYSVKHSVSELIAKYIYKIKRANN